MKATRGPVVVAAFVGLVGCEQLRGQAIEVYQRGTVAAVDQCVKNNASDLIPRDILLNWCADKHAATVSVRLDGRAGYALDSLTKRITFTGQLENKSTHVVVTRVALLINHLDHKDKDGNPVGELMVIRDLWLIPGQSQEFRDSPTFSPAPDRMENEQDSKLWTWTISAAYGVLIGTDLFPHHRPTAYPRGMERGKAALSMTGIYQTLSSGRA